MRESLPLSHHSLVHFPIPLHGAQLLGTNHVLNTEGR
jgi:hypothetical protein